jgi:hypothetical protein
MSDANSNPNVSRSKTPARKLSTQDLEKLVGVEPHPTKHCHYCNVELSFPRSYLPNEDFCCVCSAILSSLMQSKKSYWFHVQRAAEQELLDQIIEKKLLMDGNGEEISQ